MDEIKEAKNTQLNETPGKSANQFLIQADVEVLYAPLTIGLTRRVTTTESGVQKTETTFLIAPTKDKKAERKSLTDMITDINKMIQDFSGTPGDFDEAAVRAQLGSFASLTDNILIELSQVYLLSQSVTEGEKKEPTRWEYAFEFKVVNGATDSGTISFLSLKSFTLAFWNTTNPEVLSQMGINSLDAYLQA